jgi:hypothetical protein
MPEVWSQETPHRCPLLESGSITHISAATDGFVKIKELLRYYGINTRFYAGGFLKTNSVQSAFPCKRRFNKGLSVKDQATNVSLDYRWTIQATVQRRTTQEAGSNTSSRNTVSHRRRRKGKSRDIKVCSRVPRYWDPKMTALVRTRSNCIRQTRPLVRDSTPHQHIRNCLTVIKIWL